MGIEIILILVLVLGAATAGGVMYAIYIIMNPSRTASDRLRELAPKQEAGSALHADVQVDKVTERLAQLANPTDEDEKKRMRLELIQAGYTSRNALEVFNALRVGLALLFPVLATPLLAGRPLMHMFGGVIFFAVLGYYGPRMVVSSKIQERQKKLLVPFPDALDLLVSSVEAGLGLDAAFRRVADEMATVAPELSREFQIVNHEVSAGVTRIEALRHLADRTGLDEIKSLVNMLAQADRFGTSVARGLRVHANITRQKRMSRAEEEAAKVSPKLTVVMILFLMPCLLVVLLGPAAVNVVNTLF